MSVRHCALSVMVLTLVSAHAVVSVRAGVVVGSSGQVVLAMDGSPLAVGTVLTAVTIDTPQQAHRVVVASRLPEPEAMRRFGTPGPYYVVTPESGSSAPSGLAIAVLGRPEIVRVGTAAGLQVGTPPITMRVRSCTSSEGLHLTLWDGEPLESNRVWHAYHYLGYDVTPNCLPADYRDGGTAPAAAASRLPLLWLRR
jgi:hypothetical protein